ncbi:sulfatase-like hydrolase/transferase [Flagellimonas marinaquae]|uniref:sulfatase-like hydrolase/transferase n=1 Tax=Flagellimonas aurea TaxID=2915619 RepID=UPI001CE123A2|nr:sulfatase-like hydrolase/transferase [Allomuricauda aquimarina]
MDERIKTPIVSLVYGCLFLLLLNSCKAQQSNTRNSDIPNTNILVINIDDLGFHDISAYGSEIYETPNIDGLIKESYSFKNAYANYPRCLPSRYAMITATYPVGEFDVDLSNTKDEDNFIKQFSNAGYESFYVGKWHLSEGDTTPVNFGFDASYASNGAGGVASHFYPFNTKKIVAPIGEVPPVPDVEQDGRDGDYLDDLLTDRMIAYITSRDGSKPFFGMLCPYAVHTPFEAKEEDIRRNAEQIRNHDFGNRPEYVEEGNGETKMRQNDSVYAAMVENMDRNVGRILDAIERAGIKDNTILVFTSDHGGLSNRGDWKRRLATTNYPLRAGKGHLYEGGIRVPLLIRWPDRLVPQEDDRSIVALMDVMPSLLDLTLGRSLTSVDGRSFKDVILGKEVWDSRELYFYEQMARPRNTGDFPGMAMRYGNYKMYHFFETNDYELYNLANDPSEENNLVDDEPELASELKTKMKAWKSNQVSK